MFNKSARLNRQDFERCFKVGKRQHFPYCTIITFPSPKNQVAVVVGKKVSKKAVTRNVIRKRVYVSLYKVLLSSAETRGFIILVKPGYKTLSRVAANAIMSKSIAQVIKNT